MQHRMCVYPPTLIRCKQPNLVFMFPHAFFLFIQAVNVGLVAVSRVQVLAGSGFLLSASAMYDVLGHGKDDTFLAAFTNRR